MRSFMPKREIELYLHDILESILAIEDYVQDISFKDFTKDRKTYSATIREFEIIGEAVNQIINEEITKKHKTISWRDIKDFRNLLIHEYFGVDFEIVWNTIFGDLPPLKDAVKSMLDSKQL